MRFGAFGSWFGHLLGLILRSINKRRIVYNNVESWCFKRHFYKSNGVFRRFWEMGWTF